uniref:Bromodomain-containing protein 7-like n=1 Tax=Phallusia mammillata TaxID=59560 RepID=A0A6F9D771_9ASCI|nr:bromodomain-containing protein 7-like [Phallusia mammillata]
MQTEETPVIIKPIEKVKLVLPVKTTMSASQRKALNLVFMNLLRQLERKDPHEIFKFPVNDIIAPGYSSVIKYPMDFSTMKNKIVTNRYDNLDEMKADVEQMVENCCIYNKEDTIYYQMAKKLLASATKIFSKDRLASMLRSLSATNELTKAEAQEILGIEVPNKTAVDVATNECTIEVTRLETVKVSDKTISESAIHIDADSLHEAVSFTDADDALSVAPNVIEAAKEAKEKLLKKNPHGKFGILRMDDDGKTTLNLLNPDHGKQETQVVDMGVLTGGISSGIDVMPEVKEDKRNKVTPLEYLSYGAFGSFAPAYDSRISNLTQEESDLLLSAYSSDTGYLFAQSIQEFVSDCGKGLVNMVSDLLDNVTHGAHSQTNQEILEKRKSAEEKSENKTDKVKVNLDELRTLKDLGIDVSFLDKMKEQNLQTVPVSSPPGKTIQSELDQTGDLIYKLKSEQQKRLSQKPNPQEANLALPTTAESEVASNLQQKFVNLASKASPRSLVSVAGLHKAMGVDL